MKLTHAQIREMYRDSLQRQYVEAKDLHDKVMRPKRGPYQGYIPMSFSVTLLDLAGGIENVREFWETEPERGTR